MPYAALANPIGNREALRAIGDGSYAPVSVLPEAGAALDTYVCFGEAYGAYATPTDLLTISGAANKIIRINTAIMRISETTGALRKLYFVKRTAANTGGTFAAQTARALDTNSPAAAAVVNLYSVIPAGLGAGFNISVHPAVTTALTAAPAAFFLGNTISQPSGVSLTTPVVLRGASEFLALNWNGAAIGAGTSIQWELTWTESAL